MWFRLIFLMVTFGVTCWFSLTLRTFFIHDWSIEQRWMSVLLPLLILYNNPIFSLTFLMDSWVPGMLDAVFQASFLCALLLFWLCIYHGLRQNERRLLTFYLPKLLIVGPVWLCAVTMATWQKYNEHLDPTYSYQLDTSYFYRKYKRCSESSRRFDMAQQWMGHLGVKLFFPVLPVGCSNCWSIYPSIEKHSNSCPRSRLFSKLQNGGALPMPLPVLPDTSATDELTRRFSSCADCEWNCCVYVVKLVFDILGRCVVCTRNGLRKETIYVCETCTARPNLHRDTCFKTYHTLTLS
ncbi:hypothetical protein J6590_025869 [Homalodisca vitripennis]|nr:hypothetical protein J6590_025869 [Homalodisca vitripennis]